MAENDAAPEFDAVVNMTATELEKWLDTDESKDVGQKSDYAHMRKVVGYAKRHLAQRPSGDVSDSNWRYSLMNWGHDPTK
ncbi:DUF3140 domain-containing protein [Mycobacterium sp. EPa45]|uniref:DUF3140 domain-containing protein n=1 Tax=Mycobacterium sp. EPa45 TaxID=1545728 RepID=UPI000641AF61|nr:DUF3140 domain-containing protein [Mycobacterium sp. EPa45]AKK27754.1 hypothetical protein AB431_14875 [Mycobacterium sp. EPa45]